MGNPLKKLTDRVRNEVPLLIAMKHYGIAFNRSGFTRCPFHTERTASFSIKNGYGHCFGCGWNGDVITFVKEYFSLPYADAVRKLCQDFGIPYDGTERFSDQRQKNVELQIRRRKMDKLQAAYAEAEERADRYLHVYATYDRWLMQYPPGHILHDEAEKNIAIYKELSEEAEMDLGIAKEQLYREI